MSGVSDPTRSPEPKRIQLRRTKGWRKPEGAVVVARPSKWGNPWRAVRDGSWQWVEDPKGDRVGSLVCSTDRPGTRRKKVLLAVDLFRQSITPERACEIRSDLAGRDLACWCPLDQPCHADVLLAVANPSEARS